MDHNSAAEQQLASQRQMDHNSAAEQQLASAEQQLASQSLVEKLAAVNILLQEQVGPTEDYINFTLQRAYFKCAYQCFDKSKGSCDRRRRQDEIDSCVEKCSIPLDNAHQRFNSEMAKFHDRMSRALMVCKDKYEEAKLQKKPGAAIDMSSCVDQSIEDSLKTLPHVTKKLRASFGIRDNVCL